MSDIADVMRALLARAETLSHESMPLAMPEVAFYPATQAPGGRYFAVEFFANRPGWEGVASGVVDQGYLMVTVIWPRGEGAVKPGAAAQAVKAHFPKALVLTSGETKVTIHQAPYATTPLSEAGQVRIPVIIPWRAS